MNLKRNDEPEGHDAASFDRGFVVAAIVVGAIALCGLLLVVGTLFDPDPSTASTSPAGTSPAGASSAGTSSSGTSEAGGPSEQGGPATPGGVATPGGAVKPVAEQGRCGPPDGDQDVPLRRPGDTTWEVFRRVVVPRSERFGPAKVDPDGLRRCFAHSPTGAVFAAYSAVAALADNSRVVPTAARLLLPGPDTDRMLQELAAEPVASEDAPSQLAGFRVIDASRDRVTVALAMRVGQGYVSATFTLVWHDSDWRLQPPRPGQQFGAPFSQQAGLGDFVVWSGV